MPLIPWPLRGFGAAEPFNHICSSSHNISPLRSRQIISLSHFTIRQFHCGAKSTAEPWSQQSQQIICLSHFTVQYSNSTVEPSPLWSRGATKSDTFIVPQYDKSSVEPRSHQTMYLSYFTIRQFRCGLSTAEPRGHVNYAPSKVALYSVV